MVIGWRQFDNIGSNFRQAGWGYTADGGQTWTFPGVIQPGVFRSDPVLDYDTAGNFYYNSLSVDFGGTYFCEVYKSTDGGATWDNGTDAAGGDKQWMTIDRTTGEGSENIYSFWSSSFSSCAPANFTRSTDEGGSFESCTAVEGDPFWGTMAVGNAGELYIVGGTNQPGYIVVAKSLNAQVPGSFISWEIPVSVFMDGSVGYGISANPGGLLGQVNIDVDRSNGPGKDNVYVLASMWPLTNFDQGDVLFAKSTDGGLTWDSPVRVNDDPSEFNTQWLGTMSVAPNGRIDAVWLDTRDDLSGSDLSALYYSYSNDEGNTWSENEKLSDSFDPHQGYPNQDKMGDYFHMVSENSGAHLAWANTLNGEQDVYYSFITPDISIGVNEISDNASFSIFPNPTSGVFVITSQSKQSHIEIYTVLGEKVYSTTIFPLGSPSDQTKTEIDISSQPAGVYFVKVVNEDGSTGVKKIIRE
jgi:hypothetical protein